MYENIKLNITVKLLSNITPNQSTCNTSFLLLSFFWPPSHSLLWLRFPLSFLLLHADFLLWLWLCLFSLLLYTCFLLWLWLIFLLLRTGFLLWLLISTRDQNEYPKRSFSHFLKCGENKESHVFTIDNTIALIKKRSQFLLWNMHRLHTEKR